MSKAWFLTGTDTDAGKTFVACAMLHAWRRQGLLAAGFKPVAAGADATGVNEDTRRLLQAGSPGFSAAEINPVCLRAAIAPHIAARHEGIEISLPALVQAFEKLSMQCERVVVEGAGGFLVPVDAAHDLGDLAQALDLSVILVVGLRLGCINHALLTRDAILARGLRFAGWIGNTLDPAMPALEENVATLRERLPAPCLGILPRLPDSSAAADLLQLPE